MPNLIFKVQNYRNEDVVETIVKYIMSSIYIECYGSRGCFLVSERGVAECVRDAFHAVKNVYYKRDGQLVQHIIVGFGDMDVSEEQVCIVADAISAYFFSRGYQNFWGSHWGSEGNDSYRHVHMVLNTINGMTGERYFATNDNMGEVKRFLMAAFPGVSWTYGTDESFFHRE